MGTVVTGTSAERKFTRLSISYCRRIRENDGFDLRLVTSAPSRESLPTRVLSALISDSTLSQALDQPEMGLMDRSSSSDDLVAGAEKNTSSSEEDVCSII